MALTKTKIAQSTTVKDNVPSAKGVVSSKLLTMFPERPSGVSWADWDDDYEEEDEQFTYEAKQVVEPKEQPQPAVSLPPSPPKSVISSTTKDESDHIKTHSQKISFDTAVPKPILLNPGMKPNDFGLGASRWASAEPEEADNEMAESKDSVDETHHHEIVAADPEPTEPAAPATPPPATPKPAKPSPKKARNPSPKKARNASPKKIQNTGPKEVAPPSPIKAAGPGLMASRWAS